MRWASSTGGNGQPGAGSAVGPGESDCGWLGLGSTTRSWSGRGGGGWLGHTEVVTQSSLEAGGTKRARLGAPEARRWGQSQVLRTRRLVWWQEAALGAQCWENKRPRPPSPRAVRRWPIRGRGQGARQAERRGSGGTDGNTRSTLSSIPSFAPRPCGTLSPSRGGIKAHRRTSAYFPLCGTSFFSF